MSCCMLKCLCVLSLMLVGCSGGAGVSCALPATTEEISKATVNIGGVIGQGVLVGRRVGQSGTRERVFLLTARHVVTYEKSADASRLWFRDRQKGVDFSLTVDKTRWMTAADPDFDLAWLELTDEECSRLKASVGLAYVSLENEPSEGRGSAIRGTGTMRLEESVRRRQLHQDAAAHLFFRGGALSGVLHPATNGPCRISIDSNKVLKAIRPWVVGATTAEGKVARPGDSGGAAFCRVSLGGREYWMLAGLMIGGTIQAGVPYSLVYPLDVLCNKIGRTSRRLVDLPDYW